MYWKDIVGHGNTIAMLQRMIAVNRLPHALLFTGPDGVGKSLVARALAAQLLCDGEGMKPCGRCQPCRHIANKSHPDVLEIAPAGATIKIDQIRGLQREAALGPSLAQARVCIIQDAGKMTKEAANSLLKLLEEPPATFSFILIAPSPHVLLGTILSRCLTVKFLPLTAAELTQALEYRGFEAVKAAVAANLSGGRFGEALRLLEPEGLHKRDEAASLVDKLLETGSFWLWDTVAAWDKQEDEAISELFHHMTALFRDIAVLAVTGDRERILNKDLARWVQDKIYQIPVQTIPAMIKRLRAAERALAGNANTRLTLEALLIDLSDLIKEGEKVAYSCRHSF